MTADELLSWHFRSFGPVDTYQILAKLTEEVGEVAGAITKLDEGRKTLADVQDEIGDVLVCLTILAARYGWSLSDLLTHRAAEVMAR